jgi:multimeric flavodoxin WrbA
MLRLDGRMQLRPMNQARIADKKRKGKESMKILTIIGSPRSQGNSFQAAKKLEEKMKSMGEHEFEYLFLKDAHLESCLGCFACISRGDELCPWKDDRKMIEDKMKAADGLVLVSPVYVMNVTALMKNFIDRMAYFCHRPAFHGKKALVLTTTAGIGIKETLDYMERVANSWGYDVADQCAQITPTWPQTEAAKRKNRDKLLRAVVRFDRSLRSISAEKTGKSTVGFKKYLGFRIFQSISRDVKKYMPADHKFYQSKEYYQPARTGIFTKMAAAVMMKAVFFMMRDMGPDDGKTGD